MKIGVIGYQGRLGSQLIHDGCEPVDYDITSQKKLDVSWDVLINCAAYTNVDAIEVDKKNYWKAIEINGKGVDYLANNYAGKIFHISTDYVFCGKRGAYSENYSQDDDLPTRNMSYSISKFIGELHAKIYDHIKIIRTTGLYGGVSGKHDFVKMILGAYENEEPEIKVTRELVSNQTYIPHLSEAIIKYAEFDEQPKIIHIASKDVVSRYEFALMIASVFSLDKSKIIPVTNKQVPGWIAERPKNGGLKVKLAEKLGLPIYTILDGLKEYKNGSI